MIFLPHNSLQAAYGTPNYHQLSNVGIQIPVRLFGSFHKAVWSSIFWNTGLFPLPWIYFTLQACWSWYVILVKQQFVYITVDNNETSGKRNKTCLDTTENCSGLKCVDWESGCDLIPASSSRIEKHPVQLKTCKFKICSFQNRAP